MGKITEGFYEGLSVCRNLKKKILRSKLKRLLRYCFNLSRLTSEGLKSPTSTMGINDFVFYPK